jgi:hypothetical protein
MDTWSDVGELRLRKLLWRGAGLADKICRAARLPPLHRRLPLVAAWRQPRPVIAPIFMVGSPRSGTTVLGNILGHHEDLLHLSEALPIWYRVTPDFSEFDFHWEGDQLYGRIYMDERDVTAEAQAALEEDFGRMLRLSGKPRLFEKMPLNLFRVRWLNALWPDARFVQVVRDPFSTTASKTQCWPSIDERQHPGVAIRKRMYARLRPGLVDLLDSVQTTYEWYLLEWRYYTEEGERLAAALPGRYHAIRLEDAQRQPESVLAAVCDFAGLRFTNRLRRAYRVMLDRRVRLARPQIDVRRCRELLGASADRWGYRF